MSTALPTTDGATTDGVAAVPAPLPTCDACSHPLDEHDPIGVRFCAATSARGLARGCVCAG